MASSIMEPMPTPTPMSTPMGEADTGVLPRPSDAARLFDGADERAARTELRRQIARLEARLGEFEADGNVRVPLAGGRRAPRIATLAELERTRDELVASVDAVRKAADRRSESREAARVAVERAIADPADHKWLRVRSDELGDPSCKHWHVTPRLGLIGMLAGWWRVKVSSGCPLACRA